MTADRPGAARRSATVPRGDQSAADVLRQRRAAWDERPLLREVYRRLFAWIDRQLAPGPRTIELGGGAGHLLSHRPDIVVSDIVPSPYVALVADAMALPFAAGSIDNLVMIDVLHHLPRPQRFFAEAQRVLRPGGRVVMVEPYISPLSRAVFALAHPEPVDLHADPLPDGDAPAFEATGPFSSNQAIPTLIFRRQPARFAARFPRLAVRAAVRDCVLAYPLSGGFSGPRLVPRALQPLVWAGEWLLAPLKRWMAFRLLVTLERV
ncbi:MAG: methyltransferase domain-containing protein [Phycisphaerae bacterium]